MEVTTRMHEPPPKRGIPEVDQELRKMKVGDLRKFAGWDIMRVRNSCARILGPGAYTTRREDGIITVWRLK